MPPLVPALVPSISTNPSLLGETSPEVGENVLTLERKKVLIGNITQGMLDTPTLFRTENSFRSAYSYSTRSIIEKVLLDDVWNIVKVGRTSASKARILRLVGNIGSGIKINEQTFQARTSYNNSYTYSQKNSSLRAVMDEFWLIVGEVK